MEGNFENKHFNLEDGKTSLLLVSTVMLVWGWGGGEWPSRMGVGLAFPDSGFEGRLWAAN